MLQGVERLVDLRGPVQSGVVGLSEAELVDALMTGDVAPLQNSDGHFSATARAGQTVRLARTIGAPLRYFVAKMFHGPFLVVADRIDTLFDWCETQKIGWQFDPMYTRMVPAHYMLEIDQIGCPDPAPRCIRFFEPPIGCGTGDIEEAGATYIQASRTALLNWIEPLPADALIGVAFSGGVDSAAVFLLARSVLNSLNRSSTNLRAFTLDLGGGNDAAQAVTLARELGFEDQLEVITAEQSEINLEAAISVIEDYHPLDVECAAAALCLLRGIRTRYPTLKYLLDGDGGDENWKDYPLEDSDLTISSVLRNPLLYQEGWGIDAIKHSLTYTGGLSRSYVRTYAPAAKYGFTAFSPFTVRAVMAAALDFPFEAVLNDDVNRLYSLKAHAVAAGIAAVTGESMPTNPKCRFQEGAGGESYRRWRVGKSWCRQVFMKQWEDRLREAWDGSTPRRSGNMAPGVANPAVL